MSAPPIPQAVAHVVAWHNRHPLAQRITSAMVAGVGVVALPFVVERLANAAPSAATDPALELTPEPAPEPTCDATAGEPASPVRLRERAVAVAVAVAQGARAEAPPQTLDDRPTAGLADAEPKLKRRAFSERFLAQPSLARIAGFARRHGALRPPAVSLGPCRHVAIDHGLRGGEGTAWVYLHTAAINDGERRVRVLWGPAPHGAVLGSRLLSRARMAACGVAASAGILVAGLLPLWLHSSPAVDVPVLAANIAPASDPVLTLVAVFAPLPPPLLPLPPLSPLQPTSPQSPPQLQLPLLASLTTPLRAPVEQAVASAPSLRAHLASEVGPAVVATEPPPALEGALAWPVDIRPRIIPTIHRSGQPHSASSRDAPRPAARSVRAVKRGGVYALVARSTKSRAASELLLGFMQTAAAGQTKASQHTEVLPDAKGWRASWWPFTSRQDAERALATLASNGLHAEIVEF